MKTCYGGFCYVQDENKSFHFTIDWDNYYPWISIIVLATLLLSAIFLSNFSVVNSLSNDYIDYYDLIP